MLSSPNKSLKTVFVLAILFISDVLTEYVCSFDAEWCPENNYCDIAINRCMPCSHICDIFKDDHMCDTHCNGYRTTSTTSRTPKKLSTLPPHIKETKTKTVSELCDDSSSSCKPSVWNTVLEVTLGFALVIVVILLLCFMRLYHRTNIRLRHLQVHRLNHGPTEMIELEEVVGDTVAGDEDAVADDINEEEGDREEVETSPLRIDVSMVSHASQTVEEALVEQPDAVEVEIHQVSGVT